MTFTVGTITRCSGQSHWTVTITVGGQTHVIQTTPEEMAFDPAEDLNQTRQLILERLRSAAKEASANTFAQARTAVEGKVFKV